MVRTKKEEAIEFIQSQFRDTIEKSGLDNFIEGIQIIYKNKSDFIGAEKNLNPQEIQYELQELNQTILNKDYKNELMDEWVRDARKLFHDLNNIGPSYQNLKKNFKITDDEIRYHLIQKLIIELFPLVKKYVATDQIERFAKIEEFKDLSEEDHKIYYTALEAMSFSRTELLEKYPSPFFKKLIEILEKDSLTKEDSIDAKALIEKMNMKELNIRNNHGETALILAAQNGHTEIARLLIDAKAEIDIKNNDGDTALMWAIFYGHTKIVKLLIDANANTSAKNNYTRDTTLMYTVMFGKTDIVKLLIDAKAEIDVKNNYGETALMKAARFGKTDSVKLLIDAKVDIDAKDKNGETALMGAARQGHTEIIKLLIDAKAEIDAKNNDGDTALMLVTQYSETDSVKLLIKEGVNVHAMNNQGKTALDLANNHTYSDLSSFSCDANDKIKQMIQNKMNEKDPSDLLNLTTAVINNANYICRNALR